MRRSFLFVSITIVGLYLIITNLLNTHPTTHTYPVKDSTWVAPSLFIDRSVLGEERNAIIFGKELIKHTAKYFGPKGIIRYSSNKMNCENCHLDAGTRPWGNNFGAAYSKYPQYKPRSNSIQTIYDRIIDCFERSMNGLSVDTMSYSIQSIYKYIKWLGKDVPKGKKPIGTGTTFIPFITRAADPVRGSNIYIKTCSNCHGKNGEGKLSEDDKDYIYPPLWGDASYNDGAGMHRLSNLAGFIYYNMPYNIASHDSPLLNVDEAWDVAAYISSKPRPHKDQSADWPDLTKKPFDIPFAPYIDTFSQQTHKYGPFRNIIYFDSLLISKNKIKNIM